MGNYGKKNTANRFSAAKVVFENIVRTLEKGECVWAKPWINSEMPCNAVSKRPYHGYNAFSLNFISEMKGYKTNRFVTYNQAKDLGGNVRKGEHGNGIVFVEIKAVEQKDKSGNVELDKDGHPVKRAFFMSRYYTVFNIDQCDGLPESLYDTESFNTVKVQEAEDIIAAYATMPRLEHGGDEAYYSPSGDYIRVPHIDHFKTSDGYYATLFHECVHSTGAKHRLNRDLSGMWIMGGDEANKYAKEELIAEIGSAILCNACGIQPQIENAAAYCKSWLKAIREMKDTALMAAFTQGWKAAEYIQGNAAENVKPETDETKAV